MISLLKKQKFYMKENYCSLLVIFSSVIFSGLFLLTRESATALRMLLPIIPVVPALCIYARIRRTRAFMRGRILLLLAALIAEYGFLTLFAEADTPVKVLYLLLTEGCRGAVLLQLLRSMAPEPWRMGLAQRYFLLAAVNLVVWIIFLAGGFGKHFGQWLPFASGWLGLALVVPQLATYDVIRPKIKTEQEKSRLATVEKVGAWLAYCISGYRSPETERSEKERDGAGK